MEPSSTRPRVSSVSRNSKRRKRAARGSWLARRPGVGPRRTAAPRRAPGLSISGVSRGEVLPLSTATPFCVRTHLESGRIGCSLTRWCRGVKLSVGSMNSLPFIPFFEESHLQQQRGVSPLLLFCGYAERKIAVLFPAKAVRFFSKGTNPRLPLHSFHRRLRLGLFDGACSDLRSSLAAGTSSGDEARALLLEAEAGAAMSSCPDPEAEGRGGVLSLPVFRQVFLISSFGCCYFVLYKEYLQETKQYSGWEPVAYAYFHEIDPGVWMRLKRYPFLSWGWCYVAPPPPR